MRRKARVDCNQRELVNFAKRYGCTIAHLHTLGRGIPDILLGYRGKNYLIEIKSSEKATVTGKEKVFFDNWRGQAAVISNKEDLIRLLDLPLSALDEL